MAEYNPDEEKNATHRVTGAGVESVDTPATGNNEFTNFANPQKPSIDLEVEAQNQTEYKIDEGKIAKDLEQFTDEILAAENASTEKKESKQNMPQTNNAAMGGPISNASAEKYDPEAENQAAAKKVPENTAGDAFTNFGEQDNGNATVDEQPAADDALAAAEKQAAEDRAFELNPFGTGVAPEDLEYKNPFAEKEYDPFAEAENEGKDLDLQVPDDDGNEFTGGFGLDNGEKKNKSKQDDGVIGDPDEPEPAAEDDEDFDGDGEDFDGDDDDDDEDDEDDEEEDEESVAGGDQNPANAKGQKQQQTAEEADETEASGSGGDQKIKWHKGVPFTIPLMQEAWPEFVKITKLVPQIVEAGETLRENLSATGPNAMLRANEWIDKTFSGSLDYISSLLKLCEGMGRRNTFTMFAVVEALFDQQWGQVATLAGLPKILEGLFAVDPMKGKLTKIFKSGTGIVNKADKNHRKKKGAPKGKKKKKKKH